MERMKFAVLRAKGNIMTIFVIAILILLSNVCSAQVSIGPKAGVAVTTLSGSDAYNVKARTSYLGGAFINFQLAKWFTLQPEIIISQKGATYTNNDTRTELNLKYFEVPILAKVRIPIDNVFYPHVLAGPNIAFNTDARYVKTDNQSGSVVRTEGDDVRKTDVGGILGAGLDIQSKRVFFTVDGRYGYAFNYLNDNSSPLRIRNVGWTFSVGVGIRLFAGNDD